MLHSQRQNVLEAAQKSDNIDGYARLSPSTFLVNPDYTACLVGQSQLRRLFRKEAFLLLLLAFLGGFSLLICLQGLQPFLLTYRIQQTGIGVQAHVIGRHTVQVGLRGEATIYYLRYQFMPLFTVVSVGEQAV